MSPMIMLTASLGKKVAYIPTGPPPPFMPTIHTTTQPIDDYADGANYGTTYDDDYDEYGASYYYAFGGTLK